MRRILTGLSAIALLAAAGSASAQQSDFLDQGHKPQWLRHPAISPDGEMISFTYRGQIFLVDAEGGLAVPLTGQGAYSYGAVWSPDSERLAFASDINGDDDVYVADFSGTLQRYTWSSANEVPSSFSADGKSVLYNALLLGDAERSVQGALSYKPQLYSVDLAVGRERLVLPNLAEQASWNHDLSKLIYTYDPSTDPAVRQHRVVPNARQIYSYDAVSGVHTRVFAVDGIDRLNPVWSPDGSSIYYLSEASGWLNVWRADLGTGSETQLTHFENDPVRDLSISNEGVVAFNHNGRIYLQVPDTTEPTPLEVMVLEQRVSGEQSFSADSGAEFISSPDGSRFAAIINSDVYLLDRTGKYRQVTATAGEERDVAFSPDGSTLAYAAHRNHQWGLYAIDLDSEEHSEPLALHYQEIALYGAEAGNAFQPSFSPDGTKLAFVADRREVKVVDLSSGEVHTLFRPADYNSSYTDGDMWFTWSPTSSDLLVQWRWSAGAATEWVGVVPADGSAPIRPLNTAASDISNGIWSKDGTQIIGLTGLFAARSTKQDSLHADLYRIFLSEAARQDFLEIYEGHALAGATDSDGETAFEPQRYAPDSIRPQRLEHRLTDGLPPVIFAEALPDLQNLLAVGANGDDTFSVFVIDLRSGDPTLVQTVQAPGLKSVSFIASQGVLDFVMPGQVLSVGLGNPDAVSITPLRVFHAVNADMRRQAAFEQAWADLKHKYYHPDLEGRNWDSIGAKYRAYLGSIASDRELEQLLTAMYGELSASHLFVTYANPTPTHSALPNYSDMLGVYLDYGYEGQGRRVAAVLPGGPLDRASLGVDAGDIITSINGVAVPDAGGLDRLLDLNLGNRVQIGLMDHDSSEERFVHADPISRFAQSRLAHERLLDTRREMTQRLSNSCVVYQHIPAMDNDSYIDLVGRLGAARSMARAALIDVRSNGGGNLTRELITQLTGQTYSMIGREDRPTGSEPNNRWLWPSAVLVDSFGYSDGAIFPQAYQDLGIGPLVGDTVLNTGTYVDYVRSRVLPGLTYGIPVLPVRTLDGTYYENHVINPDINVPFDPNHAGIGVDPQLEAAVAALMAQLGPDADCKLP